MSGPIGIGVIGCGNVLREYMAVAQPLCAAGLIEMRAACDRRPDKRAWVRATFGIDRFSERPEDVIEDDGVSLVLVLTPMQEHAALTAAALDAGKHVLCEKTMATTLDEAAALVARVRRGPGFLLAAPHVLMSPTYQAMWRRVQQGEIGPVLSARARYGYADPYWEGGWVYRRGAGVLREFAVYNLTSLTGFLGPVRKVAAMTGIAVPERTMPGGARVTVEEEDNGHLLLDFGRGVLALVSTSFAYQRYRSPAIELYGAEGTLQMLGDDWAPAGHELWRNDAGCWTLFEETDPRWSWADGLRHLVDCIRTGQAPITTPEHAFHVLEVLIKAQQAAATGREQTVESTFTPPVIPAAPTPTTEARP